MASSPINRRELLVSLGGGALACGWGLRRGAAEPGETIHEMPLEAVVALAGETYVFVPADESRGSAVRIPVEVRELGRDGKARVVAPFPGPLLVVVEGQHGMLDVEAPAYPVREVAPP